MEITPNASASSAILDVFSSNSSLNYDESLYAVGCAQGALLVCSYAVVQAFGASKYNSKVLHSPIGAYGLLFHTWETPNSANWIPGDWGFIENANYIDGPNTKGTQGENVIYLGGTYVQGDSDSDRAIFADHGNFWGLGMAKGASPPNVMNLSAIIAKLESDWNANGKMKISPKRFNPRTNAINA